MILKESFRHCVSMAWTTAPVDQTATMMELVIFEGERQRYNIPKEIRSLYGDFGTLLLEDRTVTAAAGWMACGSELKDSSFLAEGVVSLPGRGVVSPPG